MKNRVLIIMRHAKSDWSDNAAADFDRTLTDRGKRDAIKMGGWLKNKEIIPEVIVSSPAARAKHTALIVSKESGFDSAGIIWDKSIYDATLDDLLKVVASYGEQTGCLLLIGHNPGLEELLAYLSANQAEANSDNKIMTTAAIAVLDYGKKPISAGKALAQLKCLTRPRD